MNDEEMHIIGDSESNKKRLMDDDEFIAPPVEQNH